MLIQLHLNSIELIVGSYIGKTDLFLKIFKVVQYFEKVVCNKSGAKIREEQTMVNAD